MDRGQVALGRNAVAIYQDLVDQMGFAHRYNSVKRFVRTLRKHEPERFDILDGLPGEEVQQWLISVPRGWLFLGTV